MRRCLYYWFTGLALFFFSPCYPTYSANLRPYNGKINKVISGVVLKKLSNYEIAKKSLLKPTLVGLGISATAQAGRLALVGISTVSWPVLLTNLAVSTLLSGAISLGQDAFVDWMFREDNQVVLSGPGMNIAPKGYEIVLDDINTYPEILDKFGIGKNLYFKGSLNYNAHTFTNYITAGFNISAGERPWVVPNVSLDSHLIHPDHSLIMKGLSHWNSCYQRTIKLSNNESQLQIVYRFVPGTGVTVVPPSYYVSEPKLVNEAIADVPEPVTEKPLSPEMIAAIANAVWKSAQDCPDMVPWRATNPVTPQDVKAWLEQNPSEAPTVGDFFSSVAPDTATQVSFSETFDTKNENKQGSPESGVISAPNLEETPTAREILSPILNLMPDLKSFVVPEHTGVCPTASFNIFDRDYCIDAHCTLLEENRSLIASIMLLVWTLSSMFIILRA